MISGQMDRPFKDLPCRPILSFAVALQPVLNADLRGLLGFCSLFSLSDLIICCRLFGGRGGTMTRV